MIQLQRIIKMQKSEVLAVLLENKKNHIKEYALAVEAFKKKGLIELKKATRQVERGSLELHVSLITPVKRVDYFNNVIQMFKSDIRDEIDLTQAEYNEYILDKGGMAVTASASNSAYYHAIGRKFSKGGR